MKQIRLTQFSHGSGCGCKLSPGVLESILKNTTASGSDFPSLLVGNDSKDDAAVYDIGYEDAIISTTDFFMPIVDDPFDFGRIASVNAISDVYAMGGRPIMAIAILGWPVDRLDPAIAGKVLDGARNVCAQISIPIAGGHSIDNPEPIFGLAVSGVVKKSEIKTNRGGQPGAHLFLSKPLGVGLFSTAKKKGHVDPDEYQASVDSMLKLNRVGEELGRQDGVLAMTDVTGFGLMGHLKEMCEGSNTGAVIRMNDLPLLPGVEKLIDEGWIPGGTGRNFQSYGQAISDISEKEKAILCDPQTSGGLLVAVAPEKLGPFLEVWKKHSLPEKSIGYLSNQQQLLIQIER